MACESRSPYGRPAHRKPLNSRYSTRRKMPTPADGEDRTARCDSAVTHTQRNLSGATHMHTESVHTRSMIWRAAEKRSLEFIVPAQLQLVGRWDSHACDAIGCNSNSKHQRKAHTSTKLCTVGHSDSQRARVADRCAAALSPALRQFGVRHRLVQIIKIN